jgi:voltage-gated potassium channel
MKSKSPGDSRPTKLKDLPKGERRRRVAIAIIRVTFGIVILLALYWIAPLNNQYGVHPFIVLILMLAVFVALIYFSVRRILHDDLPQLRAVQVAILTVAFYLFAFSSLYLSMSEIDQTYFSEQLTHVGAFYFTVTVAATVGFGDITAQDDLARLIVTAQMLVNIALIGVGVRAILALGKMRASSQIPDDVDL